MRAPAFLVIAVALGGGCVASALHPGSDAFPSVWAPVPADSPLSREIADGYATYGVQLDGVGQWRRDALYGVLWCPKLAPGTRFTPYVSNGHWAPGAPDADAGALDGTSAATPVWVSRGPSWMDLTTHHGWWVSGADRHASDAWCWVPGVKETPARVIWRESDGFVAWAPEPPLDDDAASDDGSDDLLAWSFEFVGTLLDDNLVDVLLGGDAAEAADVATSEARRAQKFAGEGLHRTGPTAAHVAAARAALAEYTGAHPTVGSPSGAHAALPPVHVIYGQLAKDTPAESGRSSHASLPVIPRGGSAGGGHGRPGEGWHGPSHVAAGSAGCASCRSTSSGHTGGSSHPGHTGNSGTSGGDCGSHSAHHK